MRKKRPEAQTHEKRGQAMERYLCFRDIACGEIAACMNRAFSDYPIPIHLTEEGLRELLITDGADEILSFGAFSGQELVGCLINAPGTYAGKKAAFAVAAGVVPQRRGTGVCTGLLDRAQQELARRGIETYYLEVLQENARAVQLYQKLGFSVTREFSVLRSGSRRGQQDSRVQWAGLEDFPWDAAHRCIQVPPSFEHARPIPAHRRQRYAVAYLQEQGIVTAYCVFLRENGYLIRMGYAGLGQLEEVVQWLVGRFDGVVAKNIDSSYAPVLALLEHQGFACVTRQFEMAKDLTAVLPRQGNQG